MKIKNKKNFLLILFSFLPLIIFLILPVYLQAETEIEYPGILGEDLPQDPTMPEYIRYIYIFIVAFSGIIALGVLIWGGIIWMLSGDNPSKVGEAKIRIFEGLAGVIIILSVNLILYAVNPTLSVLRVREPLKPQPIQITYIVPGYYICGEAVDCSSNLSRCLEEEIDKNNCAKIGDAYSGNLLQSNFKIYLVDSPTGKESALVFLGEGIEDSTGVFTWNSCAVKTSNPSHFGGSAELGDIPEGNIRLISEVSYFNPSGRDISYLKSNGSLPGIKLCEKMNCTEKKECEEDTIIKNFEITENKMATSFSPNPLKPVREINVNNINVDGSIESPEYFMILFTESNYKGKCLLLSPATSRSLGGILDYRDEVDQITCPDGSQESNKAFGSFYSQVGSVIILPIGGPVKDIWLGPMARSKALNELMTCLSSKGITNFTPNVVDSQINTNCFPCGVGNYVKRDKNNPHGCIHSQNSRHYGCQCLEEDIKNQGGGCSYAVDISIGRQAPDIEKACEIVTKAIECNNDSNFNFELDRFFGPAALKNTGICPAAKEYSKYKFDGDHENHVHVEVLQPGWCGCM